ncbi:MAG: dipeptidase [Sphingobacterium sp.]|uniref:dipeptidase n=1 Tax=Sphingobacterium sp. JB170 TaxID=1434842 RepID=UPI00211AB3A3|nr:dipeptidase [Sphingobacterium sp. JB170]
MKRLISRSNQAIAFGSILMALVCVESALAQSSESFHQQMIVVDGHNDVIYASLLEGRDLGKKLPVGHTDIPRLRAGGVDVQVFAVWSDDKKFGKGKAFKHANHQIDLLEQTASRYPDQLVIAKNSASIREIVKQGKIAAIIGVEGGNMIEESIENLESLYDRGARYLTLTWNYNLSWATAAAEEVKTKSEKGKGLTEKGRAIIRKMNELGMMIDLSHSGEKTFYDVMALSTKPVLVSHSNAYSLMPQYRNLKDDQLEALKKNGGVVGVNFYSGFLDPAYESRVKSIYRKHFGDKGNYKLSSSSQYDKLPASLKRKADAPLSLLLDHIDYLVIKVGVDHVAVGSDFDGIESSPQGLEDVSKFPVLTAALLERGYTKEDVSKIMGLNFLRILEQNEQQ